MRNRVLFAAVALCTAGSASGYVLIGYDWMWMPDPVSEPWTLNTGSFPAGAGSVVEIEDAFVGAMDSWNNAGNAYFSWTYAGVTPNLSYTADGEMISQWHANIASYGTLAQTTITYFGGDASECDIRFYGSNGAGPIAWSSNIFGAPPGRFDLQKVATHELGHCLGLDHSNNPGAIMFASTSDGTSAADRALHFDDVNGLNAIYTAYVPRPDLDLASFEAIDLGDGDGYFEAGELVGLSFTVDNLNDALASNAIATVSSQSADVLVNNAIGAPADIDHLGLATRTYVDAELRIAPGCTVLDGVDEYQVAFSADDYNTGAYWVIDIALDCLGPDLDNDGVPESLDLCEGHNDSADRDNDGVPNRCDPCPDDAPDDSDGDGICDLDDLCEGFDDTLDADQDGTPDDCDVADPIIDPSTARYNA